MKIVHRQNVETRKHEVALIFGLGLVGNAIASMVCQRAESEVLDVPFDWRDAAARREQFSRIEAVIDNAPIEKISTVWAAGISGFGSTDEDLEVETSLLAEILDFVAGLRDRFQNADQEFHLISSAGGLFEGIVQCGADATPNPLRPYGVGKLRQEALVRERVDEQTRRRIYRLNSVHGYAPNGRIGLITALINNGLQGKTTKIFGGLNTLRDYVWSDDIARFVSDCIHMPSPALEEIYLMANGRPVSMYEMITIVEEAIQAQLYLQIDPHPSNSSDMSYLRSALPAGWSPTSLLTGVSSVARSIRRA